MNEVIAWAVFAGAWLLVAGPLYQGSVELQELDIDREGIEGIKASAVRTAGQELPSAWWWLLPPVMYVLRRHRNRAFREATFAQLTEAQREQFTSFRNKATGCSPWLQAPLCWQQGRRGRSSSITTGRYGCSGCWSW
jgi:hypothetical protein